MCITNCNRRDLAKLASAALRSLPTNNAPLDHYDDDIIALEAHAGQKPRWRLHSRELNFSAPRLLPLLG